MEQVVFVSNFVFVFVFVFYFDSNRSDCHNTKTATHPINSENKRNT